MSLLHTLCYRVTMQRNIKTNFTYAILISTFVFLFIPVLAVSATGDTRESSESNKVRYESRKERDSRDNKDTQERTHNDRNKPDYRPESCSVSYNSTARCVDDSVVISVSFTNDSSNHEDHKIKVTPTDKQTGKSGSTKTLDVGETAHWDIDTDKTSISTGTVEFEIVLVNSENKKVYKSTEYNSAECTTDDDDDEDEPNGGTIIVNKAFKVEKEVRLEGDDSWEEKITDVEEDDVIEFKITVENISDGDDDETTFDDMRMEDFLPDELIKISGDLTEYWDDFEEDEEKTFKIKAKVDPDEYDKENLENCVVNRVEIEHDDDYEGSDTATVCYVTKKGEVLGIQELPATGATSTLVLTIMGINSIVAGVLMKKGFWKSFK